MKEGKLFKRIEMVLVNDGSKDRTAELIREYTEKYKSNSNLVIRGVSLIQNQGKGAAVKYVRIHRG